MRYFKFKEWDRDSELSERPGGSERDKPRRNIRKREGTVKDWIRGEGQ